MKRMLIAASGILVLLLAACSSGDSSTPAVSDESDGAREAVVEEGEGAPTPADDTTEAPVEPADQPLAATLSLFEGLGPLGLLSGSLPVGQDGGTGLDSLSMGGDVDPALKEALLRQEDLPPGFSDAGAMDFSFSLPADEGSLQMAMTMFFEGDIESGDLDSMVMSAAMQTPEPIPLEEFTGGFEELGDLSSPDDEALQDVLAESGLEFQDMRFFEVSGLGEAGFGMHMAMTFEGLYFEQVPSDNPFGDEVAFDAYLFVRGDQVLMLTVMWPDADAAAPVDAYALAEVMDGRAESAY